MSRPRVVVAGGGVAGLEAMLVLSTLLGPEVAITLVTPEDEFVALADSVAVPFAEGTVERHAIGALASRSGVQLVRDRLVGVRRQERSIDLASGAVLRYDALVLALGARAEPVYDRAVTFDPRHPQSLAFLLRDVEVGRARRLAVVAPPGHHWTLPAYELALGTAAHARRAGVDGLELVLAVPEHEPLIAFGPQVADATRRLLSAAGVTLWTSAFAEVRAGDPLELLAHPGPRRMSADRVIALPVLEAPRIPGINDAGGFVAVDGFGRLRGAAGVYAVGDLTSFPIKQGGLAVQQARAAAEHIAARMGAPVRPVPFSPILRGRLHTPDGDRWLRHDPEHDLGGEISDEPLWWPPGKVAGGELAAALWPGAS